jgi:hypothetical protein
MYSAPSTHKAQVFSSINTSFIICRLTSLGMFITRNTKPPYPAKNNCNPIMLNTDYTNQPTNQPRVKTSTVVYMRIQYTDYLAMSIGRTIDRLVHRLSSIGLLNERRSTHQKTLGTNSENFILHTPCILSQSA